MLRLISEQTGIVVNVLMFTPHTRAHQRVLRAAAPGTRACG